MPCHAAMVENPVSVSPDDTIEDVLALMKKKKVGSVAVVNEAQILEGLFSIPILFKNLLPVSVALAGGVQVDVSVQAAPGVAKRLNKVGPLKVSEVMQRKVNTVYPETPTWEGINLLTQHGSPLMVVADEGGQFHGIVTFDSALDEIQRLKDSE